MNRHSLLYKIELANEDDVRWIAHKAYDLYGETDSVPESVKLSWFRKNQRGFWIIKRKADRVGSCEILTLKRTALKKLMEGTIKERELMPKDIYGPEEAARVRVLYLENVMAVNESNIPIQGALKELMIQFEDIITNLGVDPVKTKIYAMPVSNFYTAGGPRPSNSEKILAELKFSVAGKTKQDYPLYCANAVDILYRSRIKRLREIELQRREEEGERLYPSKEPEIWGERLTEKLSTNGKRRTFSWAKGVAAGLLMVIPLIGGVWYYVYSKGKSPDQDKPAQTERKHSHYERNGKSDRVIVFVHGLFGDAEDTWTCRVPDGMCQ